jgi:hypothetical protein
MADLGALADRADAAGGGFWIGVVVASDGMGECRVRSIRTWLAAGRLTRPRPGPKRPPSKTGHPAVPIAGIDAVERRLSLADRLVARYEALIAKRAALGLDTKTAVNVLRGLQQTAKARRADLDWLLGKVPDGQP